MVPSVGSGFSAAFACVDQKMAPNRAQLPQQFLGSSQERARDGVPHCCITRMSFSKLISDWCWCQHWALAWACHRKSNTAQSNRAQTSHWMREGSLLVVLSKRSTDLAWRKINSICLGLTVEDAMDRLKGVNLVCLGDRELGLWRLADSYPKAQREVLDVFPKIPAPLLSLKKPNINRLDNPRQGRP